jgi:hypothetical protein
MRRMLALLFVGCLTMLGVVIARHRSAQVSAPANAATSQARALEAYGKLPLNFEENAGQSDTPVRYLAHGAGYAVFLTDGAMTLRLDRAQNGEKGDSAAFLNASTGATAQDKRAAVLRFTLARSNRHPAIQGLEIQPAHSNYFIGNDPAKWHRNVPQFSRVRCQDVYPGIAVVYYGNQGRLESDFVVAPGADPRPIALRIEGANSYKLDSNGDLVMTTPAGEVSLQHPYAYQEIDGARHEVTANYVPSDDGLFGVNVGSYDTQHALVIDPVVAYSTFLSGSTGATFGSAIAVDSAGNAYIVGATTATDFPVTSSAFQKVLNAASNGQSNAYVTKLNPTGTAQVFSTYLGGSGTTGRGDGGNAIAVDASGNVLVVGATPSTDFPIVSSSAFQVVNNGTPVNCFLTKVDPTGSTLLYSTYLGGSGSDSCSAIALDSNGNAYMTGTATSTNFPVTPGTAIQTTGKSLGSAFVTRINTTNSGSGSLIYSTLLGGSKADGGNGIAVDSSFNAYITGKTTSPDFPITSATAFQTAMKGTAGNAFISEVSTTAANSLIYSTYLGGTATNNPGQLGLGDFGAGIALDRTFNVYAIGNTESADFPTTAGSFQATPGNSAQTAFVARLNTTKSGAASLVYSTILGGSVFDNGTAITVDSLGNAYLTGGTQSTDFPVTPAGPQQQLNGTLEDIFVSVLDPTGSSLLFSTFYGGTNSDSGSGIALDTASIPNIYVAGTTLSKDFLTSPGAFQVTFKTGSAFALKLSPAAATGVLTAPASLNFGNQPVNTPSSPLTVTVANFTKSTLTISGISFTGANAADFSQTNTCGTTLAANATCKITIIFTPTTSGSESATLSIADSDPSSPQTVPLSGTGTGGPATPDFSLTATPATATITAGSSATYTATLTSLNSFAGTVTLTCTGAPLNSTCAVSPASETLAANGTQSPTVTLTTTARGILAPRPTSFPLNPRNPINLWAWCGLFLALLVPWIASRQRARKLAWSFALVSVLAFSGCSGLPQHGGGGGGAPAGVYTLSITGTSGSLTHSTTVSVTVN